MKFQIYFQQEPIYFPVMLVITWFRSSEFIESATNFLLLSILLTLYPEIIYTVTYEKFQIKPCSSNLNSSYVWFFFCIAKLNLNSAYTIIFVSHNNADLSTRLQPFIWRHFSLNQWELRIFYPELENDQRMLYMLVQSVYEYKFKG